MSPHVRIVGPQENPFDLNKASDFSDSEIAEQWVDLTESSRGLLEILRPTLRMPMLLLGGKGSGKTHLMRYCSAPVQAKRRGGDLVRAIEQDGYLGVYIRADALNTDKFAETETDGKVWDRLFRMYFELWLATVLIEIFNEYLRASDNQIIEQDFALDVAALFDADVSDQFNDISTLVSYLTQVRKNIDFSINNSHLRGDQPNVTISFSVGKIIFGLPRVISKHVASLSDVLIVYLIDEVENLTVDQQKFLNSLIRYRSGNVSIKLGARLYGIKTYDTLGAGEPIKRDAEYERVELDSILRDRRPDYNALVRRLIDKRLKLSGFAGETTKTAIADYFSGIDSSNYYGDIENDLQIGHGKSRPFHDALKRDLVTTFKITEDAASRIIKTIQIDDRLFLDKAAAFYFRKKWPSSVSEVAPLADDIARQSASLIKGDKAGGSELHQMISHFGSDILAQLYRDYRRRVPYAGFDTMVDLSQGIIRNLLTNLKHIYRRSQFAGEDPFSTGTISVKSQSDGVRDGAAWFWEDAQPPSHGLQVREAVESLAVIFRTIRLSHAPSECDLCTFSVASHTLTDNSRNTLQTAENWSYLIRDRHGRRNKNNRTVDDKFQLGPMLAPRWDVSEHRRGSIELNTELANAILDPAYRPNLPALLKERLARFIAPASPTRGGLFE